MRATVRAPASAISAAPARSRKPRRLLRRSTAADRCSCSRIGGRWSGRKRQPPCFARAGAGEDALELGEAVEGALGERDSVAVERYGVGAARNAGLRPYMLVGDLVEHLHRH